MKAESSAVWVKMESMTDGLIILLPNIVLALRATGVDITRRVIKGVTNQE